MKAQTTLLTAGVLIASLMAASPAALAHGHDKHPKKGKWDKHELCEDFREGKGPFNYEKRQAERAKHLEEMAKRLKLDNEQRKIWNEIHEERKAKHEKRMKQLHKKMQERCSIDDNKDK